MGWAGVDSEGAAGVQRLWMTLKTKNNNQWKIKKSIL
jgi:hypothetical protein